MQLEKIKYLPFYSSLIQNILFSNYIFPDKNITLEEVFFLQGYTN